MKKIITSIALILAFWAISCTEDTGDQAAVKMTLAEISEAPGYAWFAYEYDSAIPIADSLPSIEREFDAETDFFLMFAKPGCSCEGLLMRFPKAMKIITEAGITENNFEIYSAGSITSPHPYQDELTINLLPALFLLKDGTPTYSVFDSLDLYTSQSEDLDLNIETFIIEALKQ